MATYAFSTLTNGQSLAFDPLADTLSFDSPAIAAAQVVLGFDGTSVSLAAGGKKVTLVGVAWEELSLANVAFADGSQLRVGDGAGTTASDNVGNAQTGGDGSDQLLGLGGADTLDGGLGNDRLLGGTGADRLYGGGGDDVVFGFGAQDQTAATADIVVSRVGATTFARPVFACAAPGDPDRLYVIEQHTGKILILDTRTGAVNAQPFLDIPDAQLTQGGEQGLLGLAFHPDYATNGRFYVYLTNASGDVEVRAYQRSAGNANLTDPASGDVILTIDKDNGAGNHNGGWIGFGPDGLLYVAVGDEGGAGDPANNAQNLDVLWGKILRIDVDGDDFPQNAARDYAIPDGNPYAASPGADEIWASGLRNPWRASFDRLTGDFYIGDVGQGAREEVNYQAAGEAGGANYGWKVMEGTLVYDDSVSGNPPPGSPLLTGPVVDYGHDAAGGFAIVGGYVYRGESAGMQGRYLYADFVSDQLWSFRIVGGQAVDVTNHTSQLVIQSGKFADIVSFAEDGRGNLYAISLSGEISRLAFGAASADGADLIDGGAGDDALFGGAGADTVRGGADDDTLHGGAQNDVLAGGLGNDVLYGGPGNDILTDTLGSDTLVGGAGSDIYAVTGGDVVSELAGQGIDVVQSTVGHALAGNVENLVLVGGAPINGTGNALGNRLTGNAAANVLSGLAGNDAVAGNAGADVLLGGLGNDVLSGGPGNDTLTGGAGRDVFRFDAAPSAAGNRDAIADFVVADDTIQLENAVFAKVGAAGTLAAAAFWKSATASAAHDATDRVIYNTTTGALYYDPDGTGPAAKVQIATLTDSPDGVTSADFVVT